MKLVHPAGFITKKFVTMHGHMNVKKMRITSPCLYFAISHIETAVGLYLEHTFKEYNLSKNVRHESCS